MVVSQNSLGLDPNIDQAVIFVPPFLGDEQALLPGLESLSILFRPGIPCQTPDPVSPGFPKEVLWKDSGRWVRNGHGRYP